MAEVETNQSIQNEKDKLYEMLDKSNNVISSEILKQSQKLDKYIIDCMFKEKKK